MSRIVVLGQNRVENKNAVGIGTWFYPPVLANTTTPPRDQTRIAFGAFNNILYYWNTVTLAWIPVSQGTILSGKITLTATGGITDFTYAHGLSFNPTTKGYEMTPLGNSASGLYSHSADATNFYFNYDVAPTINPVFVYSAKN